LVLVTGAAGFIGSNVVRCLREHGFAVRALLRAPPDAGQWKGCDDVHFVVGDVRDAQRVEKAMDGVSAVIHSAALVQLVPRPRRRAFDVNLEGTRIVCEAALRAGVRRLVNTSSAVSLAPGSPERPADEEIPYRPAPTWGPYHQSKWLAEKLVAACCDRGLETISLCPGFVIGPGDYRRPTTNELIVKSSFWPIRYLPPGGMNLIDVREAALAHVRALWLGEPGRKYFLGGSYLSFVEVANTVHRIVGRRVRARPLPRWTFWPGAVILSVINGFMDDVPNSYSVPSFRYSYVACHTSGARADRAFQLSHRPLAVSIWDTLNWFCDHGRLPWLRRPLVPPPELCQSEKPHSLVQAAVS
jgi:dihydroflavonol-4-reductase